MSNVFETKRMLNCTNWKKKMHCVNQNGYPLYF